MKSSIMIRINQNMREDIKAFFSSKGTNTVTEVTHFLNIVIEEKRLPFVPISEPLPQYIGNDKMMNVPVDELVKKRASEIARNFGMNLSSLIIMFFRKCLIDQKIPYEREL